MRSYLNQFGGAEILIYVFLAVAIGLIVSIFIGSKVPKFRQDKRRYLIYMLTTGLFFLIFGAILYNLKGTTLTDRFLSVQAFMLIAGSVHLILFRNLFKRFDSKSIFKELAISFVSAIFLSAFVIATVAYFKEFTFLPYMLGTVLVFFLPTMSYTLFETAISIPVKLHKRWFYPVSKIYPDPHSSDMRNIIILNLVFQKKDGDKHIINFKVKAPRAFEFGRLFYYFINDYNEKNPNSQIHYLDSAREPYGWYFYTKPQWFSGSNYIDPDLAIDTNNLKDGQTIICQRI
ncbi:TssN family type VI secretion system protein [Flavobacterium sp.]|uniref:TssN family type VI secretion system protein n=1 Tax=Flavobacterium sp. TaxID=239 RepID=UPI0012074E19|nr:TssN family type VI secretion system protein [Flavobacterium sp.]RZJ70713.1 MAG: hypothetical protein EOO49_12740 [Flavobacterium sp.]